MLRPSGIILILVTIYASAAGQDLEPRSLSNAPVGLNFIVTGYGYSTGNVLFDPSVPIENANARLHQGVTAYLRTIDFFGLPGKVDLVVPYVFDSYWEGVVDGEPASTKRAGFGDPRIRLSVNFIGSPLLSLSEFGQYSEKTTAGASLQIRPPLGEYLPGRLVNLGSNRWTFKPQVGISHKLGRWVIEGYFSVWLFTANDDFLGVRMTQKPIYAFKTHVAFLFKKGPWIAFDAGYGGGGRTTVDELPKQAQRNYRLGATASVPLSLHHSLKINFTTGLNTRLGADFDTVALVYQYRWSRKPKQPR